MLDVAKIRKNNKSSDKKLILGNSVAADYCYEGYKDTQYNKNSQNMIVASSEHYEEQKVNLSWLKGASETYDISDNPKDYVIVPVPLVTADFPNRNLQGFPYEELTFFDPYFGNFIYRSFLGKPTHIDHKNEDPLQAKGVNFDVSFKFIPKYNIWKIIVLSGFDRTKDKYLAEKIIKGDRPYYSMGALVEHFICSICGTVDEDNGQKNCCDHMKHKGKLYDGKLAYQMCVGVNYIENSSVSDPAEITAESPDIYLFD
jgi:hypothetical protein